MWDFCLIVVNMLNKWMNKHTYTWVHSHLRTCSFVSFVFKIVCQINEQHTAIKGQNQPWPSRNCSQLFGDTIPAKQWQGDMKHSWESRVGVSKRAFQNWLQPFSKPALGTTPSASEFSCINYVCLFIPLVPLHKTHCWWALSLKLRVLLEKKKPTNFMMN